MLYSLDELKVGQKIYVSRQNTDYYMNVAFEYVVYQISKLERKGVGQWFIELKTNARNKKFKKTIRTVSRYTLDLSAMGYEVNNSVDEIRRNVCLILKKSPDKNPKLLKKMMDLYPQNFV